MDGNASRPASLARRLVRSRLLTFGMIAAMLLASAGLITAQSPDDSGSTTPVTVTVTTLEETHPGRSWEDSSGNHLRGQQLEQELAGDLTGTASTVVNRDGTAESETIWITAQVESDSGSWSYRAIFTADQDGSLALYSATLVGQGGNAGQTVVFDQILEETGASITLSDNSSSSSRRPRRSTSTSTSASRAWRRLPEPSA
ncbi:MAG: hypothetical protein R3A46_10450 [Thermomicrobiales bacterium]